VLPCATGLKTTAQRLSLTVITHGYTSDNSVASMGFGFSLRLFACLRGFETCASSGTSQPTESDQEDDLNASLYEIALL
jgi:hypothetical protein